MNNPFTLSFGRKPLQFISRIAQTNQVIETFQSDVPSTQIYMISGVRGSGKTVMMTTIAGELKQEEDWIVVELNPMRDMLQSLAAKIYGLPHMKEKFIKAKLDFSALGLGVSIERAAPVTDIEDAIGRMLAQIKKDGKHLLITMDEAVNSENVKIFTSAFQIFMREEYPVFLLMTGLYENIHDLQNDKSMTFLYRAPKLIMKPLSLSAICESYRSVFGIDTLLAREMAALTKGYPFAYQVLGYLYWNERNEKTLTDILPEYDQYLEEYVYSKIWSELSQLDKKIIIQISASDDHRVKTIREALGMKSDLFSVYRDRLKKKGIIDTQEYGKLYLSLPRFEEFAQAQFM